MNARFRRRSFYVCAVYIVVRDVKKMNRYVKTESAPPIILQKVGPQNLILHGCRFLANPLLLYD